MDNLILDKEKADLIEKDIIEKLPQIPYVVDQISSALTWVKEVTEESKLLATLEFASEVEKYVSSISQPNFYKIHLLIGALLMDIENAKEDKRFEIFKTASKAVENTLDRLVIDPKLTEERGCFVALSIQLVQMIKKDEDCFCISLLSILNDLKIILAGAEEAGVKTPITPADYIKVLGYSFTLGNIRMANIPLLDRTSEILNKVSITLNKFNY